MLTLPVFGEIDYTDHQENKNARVILILVPTLRALSRIVLFWENKAMLKEIAVIPLIHFMPLLRERTRECF